MRSMIYSSFFFDYWSVSHFLYFGGVTSDLGWDFGGAMWWNGSVYLLEGIVERAFKLLFRSWALMAFLDWER